MKSIPKPTRISPIWFTVCFLEKIPSAAPINTAIGAKFSGLNIPAHWTEETSQPVTVVPMFAPIIIPTVCCKFISPAFTKPTTITVVAEEL